MPTNDDIFRAFSCDFFSKLLATPEQKNDVKQIGPVQRAIRRFTVDKNIQNDHHEQCRPKIADRQTQIENLVFVPLNVA